MRIAVRGASKHRDVLLHGFDGRRRDLVEASPLEGPAVLASGVWRLASAGR